MADPVTISKRLFIGGLSEGVTENEILERFSRFGKVSNVSLKTRVDDSGEPLKCFAHLNLQGEEASIRKCFNTYQNAKWKGSVLKLQYAKESVLERLQKEREEQANVDLNAAKPETKKAAPVEVVATAKGVPGTPVPGKKDWVVGKYGRTVPVLKLKKSYKIPMVKHDPSKYCHTAKVFKDEAQDLTQQNSCTNLTWEINKPDSEITKKRKGEFPENSAPPKKKPVSTTQDNSAVTRGSNRLPPSGDVNSRLKSLAAVRMETDDLEVVKIGAVIKKPTGTNLAETSNRFDSDLDSDGESDLPVKGGLPISEKISTGKSQMSSRSIEKKSIVSPVKQNKVKQRDDNGVNMFKSEGATQNEDSNGSSTNRAGIPEFRGLAMLGGLSKSLAASKKSLKVSNNLSPENQAEVPSSGSVGADSVKSSLSNGLSNGHTLSNSSALAESAAATSLDRSSVPSSALRDSSIVAKRIQDVTIATPAPFNASTTHNGFKTSTPNVPSSPSRHGIAQTVEEPEPFRLIPEFKGLGMIVDYSVSGNKKDSLVKSHESKCTSDPKQSLGSENLIVTPKVRDEKSGSSLKQNVKALKPLVDASTSIASLKPTPRESPKQRKFSAGSKEVEDSADSDSSAGTDEIILRHKEKKTSGSTVFSKPENSSKLTGLTTKPLQGKVSVDKSLAMSEFISGVDESGNVQNPSAPMSHRSSDDDSHDSDLDSNDFALVAKKLRQRAMLSKQGTAEKMRSNLEKNKHSVSQRERAAPLPKDVKDESKQNVTEVQNKLLSLAGSKRESAQSVKAAGTDSQKQDKQGHPSEKEKHRAANEKRLEAVKQQAKQRQQQQQLMQQALRNVDSSEGNKKRIVFDSSDEDSEDEDKKAKISDNKTRSPASEKVMNDENGQKQEKSGPALFASTDDDESEEEDYDEMFKSKPQFEGKKGEKLLKLENRFGDKRFKMDAKFADTDSEDDDNSDEKDDTNGDSDSNFKPNEDEDLTSQLKEEKSSSLKVLESVVGKSTLDRFSEKISRNTKKIIDMNTVRFDPTKLSSMPASGPATTAVKPGNVASSKPPAPDKSKAKEKKVTKSEAGKAADVTQPNLADFEDHGKEEEEQDAEIKRKEKQSVAKEDLAESKGKTNVELSSSLLNMFKAKAEQNEDRGTSFSLTQQFGNASSEEEDEPASSKDNNLFQFEKNQTTTMKVKSASERKELKQGKDMEQEDSDNEDERNDAAKAKTTAFTESDLSSEEEKDDEELKEARIPQTVSDKSGAGIDEEMLNAGRVDVRFTKDQWLEQWEALRQNIIKIYKKKHKDALKKKRIHGETKRKKEFLKNSRKTGKKNWGGFKKR